MLWVCFVARSCLWLTFSAFSTSDVLLWLPMLQANSRRCAVRAAAASLPTTLQAAHALYVLPGR